MKQAGVTTEVAIADLSPHPENYRAHPHEQVRRIRTSLETHGQYRPLVVQKSTMRILAGHGVWEAAKSRGEETIQATIIDCTDEQALMILVDDNELARWAVDDETALARILSELDNVDLRTAAYESDGELKKAIKHLEVPALGDDTGAGKDPGTGDEICCPKCGFRFKMGNN